MPNTGTYHIEFLSNSLRTGGAPTYYMNWTRVRTYPPNGGAATYTFGTPSNFILNPNPPHISNAIIDIGQYSIINTIILTTSNGIAPFTGNWATIAPNSLTAGSNTNTITANILVGTTINSVLEVNAVSTTNIVFTFNIPSLTTQNTFYANALAGGLFVGAWSFNAIVLDSGTNAVESEPVALTINPALGIPTITVWNTLVDVGQYVAFNALATGGSGSYTYNFMVFNAISNTLLANQLGTSNTFAFATNSQWPANSP